MNIKKSINLIEIVIDEVALEGLDGITLEALWQRLAIRLGDSLPLKNAFMEQIWKICLEIYDFTFYELETAREKLIIFDRYELEYLNLDTDKEYEQREIYLHCSIEDTKLGIRGSCSTYYTRKNISEIIKSLTVSEASDKYGQKLVIVASQNLREHSLIGDNISSTLHLPLMHYCLLERIGRARRIGEVTINKTCNIKEDAKALFYIRKGLQNRGLIRKQVYYQGNSGPVYNGQNTGTLIHLTRFFNIRKPKVIMWAEHLINYLKSKENYAAEYYEVKNELNIDYTIKKFFKINLLQKVFRTDVKVPYRSYYPNSEEKEWQIKNNTSKERIIKLVTLANPNIEISDLWRTEEVKEDYDHLQLNLKNQKLNVPFLKQIYNTVESKETKGVSQTELAVELGFTKLISRTLVRNLVKAQIVSTYLDDIGRQRTTKFVSRKFDGKSSFKKQIEVEISKMKEYNRSMQTDKVEGKLCNDEKLIKVKSEESTSETITVLKDNVNNNSFKDQLFKQVNHILWKYKVFKNKNRYQCTSSKKNFRTSKLVNLKENANNKGISRNNTLNKKEVPGNKGSNIVESDFYKTIETKLIVQKPECKKKSQKIAVVGFMKNVDNSDNNKSSCLSYRLLRRANLIIESVKEHKIIEDTQTLVKYINAEEDKEGLDVKIDKNSLIRLLQKLAEDNFIKYIKLILKNKKLTEQKEINFICDPSINVNDTVIQSAIEQAKLKFCMMDIHTHKSSEISQKTSELNAITRLPTIRKRVEEKVVVCRNNRVGKKYGYSPKFIRMRTLHIFLYHLIYDHPEKNVPKNVFLENLKGEGLPIDDMLDSNVNVYSPEINWKMFIPPLRKHRGYPSGWALMCDVLLRVPLSLFVKLHNVNYEVPGLQELLDHPINRHFLVKDLPTPIRNMLFLKRKYIFSIHEIVTRLCYLGLVQFGPQMLKEKDQVFIYLNRRTELLDTTSSAAGYHRIEDKPYPATKFTFTSIAVVENYWYEMWNTCINTCLGGRSVVEGKDILLEDLSRKIEMIQALKVRLAEEADKYDTGFVPGDRKGAAGIDSAFFPHLKRNWNWVSTGQNMMEKTEHRPIESIKLRRAPAEINAPPRRMFQYKSNKVQTKRLRNPLKPSQPKTTGISTGIHKPSPELPKSSAKLKREKGQINLEFPVIAHSKPPKIIRKVLPRKPMRKRVKYDEIDFSALQRMDKLRVDWEQHEDNILLVCKVAMVYLCPNPRRNLVSFTAIRDILRSYSFTSHNKTSRACQRRLLYMLKQPKTVNSVLLGVEEVKQDYLVNKRFGSLVDSVRGESENPIEYEMRIEKTFKDLVTYIAKKYYNISNMEEREPVMLPKTIQELNIFYKLKLPTRTITSPGVSKEVREVNDIHTATINSVIHSSMCCGKERRSWAYQLFKVYQQYPEYLLRSAMLKIRADQMVTMKKNYMCAYKKFGNCMPMSSSQYQLSSAYYYKFQTKWPYEVFSESYNILLSLFENYAEKAHKPADGVEMKPGLGGVVAAIHDYLGDDNMDIDIEIPDQIIMLDPALPEKDEVYQRIALRYQTILEGLSSDYAEQSKNSTSNKPQSNNMSLQANSNDIEQASINDEQQSFVEIRSAKRSGEHDYCLSQAKKRKLDSNENQFIIEKQKNEENETEIEKINEGIRFIIESSSFKQDEDVTQNDNEKMLSLDKCDDISTLPISFESIDIDYTSEQIITNIESLQMIIPDCPSKPLNNLTIMKKSNHCDNVSIQPSSDTSLTNDHTKKDRSEIENSSVIVQSFSCQPLDSISKIDKSSPLIENTSINIEAASCEPMNNNICNNTNIQTDSCELLDVLKIANKESGTSAESPSCERLDKDTADTKTDSSQATESDQVNSIRVNELVRRVHGKKCFMTTTNIFDPTEDVETRVDIHDVRTRQTRIAMLKMREELHDLTFHDSHHAHEYFVVNSFKLFYSLMATDENRMDVTIYRGMELPRKLLPIDVKVANKVLDDVKKFAVFPKNPMSYDDFKREVVESELFDWEHVNRICKFIKVKAEFGATLHELVTNFEYLNNKLADILLLLSEKRIVLRAGIVTVRYIYCRYINPWIIHSYKILRLEKESHQTVPEGSVYVFDNEDNIVEKDTETKRVTTAANLFYNSSIKSSADDLKKDASLEKEPFQDLIEKSTDETKDNHMDLVTETKNDTLSENKNVDESNTQETKTESADDADESLRNRKRLRRNRTVLLKQKDIYRAAKLLDFNTAEEIKVVVKPWIRIDGVLNRRVLDRMLGAVLCYCIEKPGMSLTTVQNRFSPAIQPYHTRELIEILVKLSCLKTTVQRIPKVTLFSKPAKPVLTGNPDLVADSDLVFIEPTIQATLRFGMFLSNRSYNLDFLSSL